jgi:hypothetical protein
MHKSYEGERRTFTSFEKNECESDGITFGDNNQGQVLGFDKIAITTKHSISKVLLVESLDYNLLSVSQICEIGYNYLFTDKGVTVFRRSDDSFAFKCVLRGKLYLVDFILEEVELDRCLIAKTNIGWLWHRRLTYVGMRDLHKLQRDGHILRLTHIILRKIDLAELASQNVSWSPSSCQEHNDNHKTIGDVTYGLVWSHCIYKHRR